MPPGLIRESSNDKTVVRPAEIGLVHFCSEKLLHIYNLVTGLSISSTGLKHPQLPSRHRAAAAYLGPARLVHLYTQVWSTTGFHTSKFYTILYRSSCTPKNPNTSESERLSITAAVVVNPFRITDNLPLLVKWYIMFA